MKAIIAFQGKFRFLSNFWLVEVWYEGRPYRSVEHAFQAAKTDDQEMRKLIQSAETPGRAKILGRKVELRWNWESLKIEVMKFLLRQKFKPGSTLDEWLLRTGEAELQEGNRWGDALWGVDLRTGKGQNHLGKLLMQIRTELKGKENAKH